jgi:hypothetical protein
MKAERFTVRYLGFQPLPQGGRRLNFSVTDPAEDIRTIFVDASSALFSGPSQLAIQECAGICSEVIRSVVTAADPLPAQLQLTAVDVAKYRDGHKNLRISRIRSH